MNPQPDHPPMDQDSQSDKAGAYYEEHTEGLYLSGWNPDHIHWGLFEPGECPAYNERLAGSKGLARGGAAGAALNAISAKSPSA